MQETMKGTHGMAGVAGVRHVAPVEKNSAGKRWHVAEHCRTLVFVSRVIPEAQTSFVTDEDSDRKSINGADNRRF